MKESGQSQNLIEYNSSRGCGYLNELVDVAEGLGGFWSNASTLELR